MGCEAELTSIRAMRNESRTLLSDIIVFGTKQNPLHSFIPLNEAFLLRDTVQVKQALIVLNDVQTDSDTLNICGINFLNYSNYATP